MIDDIDGSLTDVDVARPFTIGVLTNRADHVFFKERVDRARIFCMMQYIPQFVVTDVYRYSFDNTKF